MRRPGRLVFHHHQSLESIEVVRSGVRFQRAVRSAGLGSEAGHGHRSGDVPRQRTQQASDSDRIPRFSVDARKVNPANLLKIVAVGAEVPFDRRIEVSRPAADRQDFRDRRDRQRRWLRGWPVAVKQFSERTVAARNTQFEQRHGTHPETGKTSGAGVAGDVVGGDGRPGEDELARFAPIIHRPAHVVPDRRSNLPFVKGGGGWCRQEPQTGPRRPSGVRSRRCPAALRSRQAGGPSRSCRMLLVLR